MTATELYVELLGFKRSREYLMIYTSRKNIDAITLLKEREISELRSAIENAQKRNTDKPTIQ